MTSARLLFCLILIGNVSSSISFQYGDDDEVVPYSTIRMRRRLYAKRRHRHICNIENDERNNEKLKEVVAKSDFVFTGKVVSYYKDEGHWTKGVREMEKRDGEKREKRRRPKKGRNSTRNKTSETVQELDERNSIDVNFSLNEDKSETFVVELKRVIKGSAKLSGLDRVVVRVPKQFVSGLEITSDPTLNTNCVEFHPVLKIRQTAILLANGVDGIQILELTYFPVAMTLRHLDRVDAAVSGRIKLNYFILQLNFP